MASHNQVQQTLLAALEQHRGDDLERATRAFAGVDMSQQHGFSGRTRQEILDEYRAHADLVDQAVAWVKNNCNA